jgi:hypothetical protein
MSDIIFNNINNEIINYENDLIKDLTFFNNKNEYVLTLSDPTKQLFNNNPINDYSYYININMISITNIYILININDYNNILYDKNLFFNFINLSISLETSENILDDDCIFTSLLYDFINNIEPEIIDNNVKMYLFKNKFIPYILDNQKYYLSIECNKSLNHIINDIYITYKYIQKSDIKYNHSINEISTYIIDKHNNITNDKYVLQNYNSPDTYIIIFEFDDDNIMECYINNKKYYMDEIDKIKILNKDFGIIKNNDLSLVEMFNYINNNNNNNNNKYDTIYIISSKIIYIYEVKFSLP